LCAKRDTNRRGASAVAATGAGRERSIAGCDNWWMKNLVPHATQRYSRSPFGDGQTPRI
jgi:hypothetical protein